MNFGRLVSATVFLVAFVFFSGFASASTNVSVCGTLSSANTSYVLNRSLNATSTCITVGANNITLDCQGYVINYSATSAGYGVYVDSYNYTTVENCSVNLTGEYGRAYAVYYLNSNNGTVYNNTIMTLQSAAYYDFGVYLDGGSYNNISSNNITTSGNSGDGIDVEDTSTNNSIISNNVTTSGDNGYGIYFYTSSDSNTVFNNRVVTSGNWGRAIYGIVVLSINVSNNVVVTSNTGGVGIVFETGGSLVVAGNNITTTGASDASGIYLSGDSNCNVANNSVTAGAGASGIYLYSTDAFSNDNATGNNVTVVSGGYGIYLEGVDGGANYSVTGNNVTVGAGGYGVFISGSKNNSVSSTTITASGSGAYGVYLVASSNNSFTNTNVTTSGSAGYGVYLESSSKSNNFTSCSVQTSNTNAYGVYLTASSNNSFTNTSVVTSGSAGYGVYLVSSSGTNNFTGCSVQTNGTTAYAFYPYSSTGNLVKDSVLNASSSGVADVYSRGTGVNNFTNCSFNKSDTNFYSGATASVNVFSYLNVHAIYYLSSDLASTILNISDVNGTSLYNGTTNSTGWMSTPLTVQEYMQNGTTSVYNKTPHWINASKTGYASNNTATTISGNVVATRTLYDPPTVSLNSPADGATESASFNFGYTPLDAIGFSGASLILWYSNGTLFTSAGNASAVVNNSVNYLTYAFTMEGAYLWNVNVSDTPSQALTCNASSNRTVFIVYPQGGSGASASPAASETPTATASATASASAGAGATSAPGGFSSPAPTLEPSLEASASPGVEPSVSPPSATASAEERGAFDALTEVKSLRDSAQAQGVVSSDVNDLIVRSAQAYAAGDYAGAASFASQAKSLLEEKLVAAGVQKPSAVAGFDWTWVVGFLVLVVLAGAYYYYSRKQKHKGL